MKLYCVDIITCPECGHEKTKLKFVKMCIFSYTCKKCKKKYNPTKHIKWFCFNEVPTTHEKTKH